MLVARVMASRLRRIETPGGDRSCMAIEVVSQLRRRHPRRRRTPRRLRSVHWYVDNVDINHSHPDNDTTQRFDVSPIGSRPASPRRAVPPSK